jgi:hypothetical protein
MRSRARPGVQAAAAAPGTACPAAGRSTGRRLIAAMLIAAAALDLTRCSLVVMTIRHADPAVGLVAAGIGAAVMSVTAARGYRAGQRWAAWAALLIGVASAPQASASGFDSPYVVPDVATAALGVLLTVAILATAGRAGPPVRHLEIPCVMSRVTRPSAGQPPGPRTRGSRTSGTIRDTRDLPCRRVDRPCGIRSADPGPSPSAQCADSPDALRGPPATADRLLHHAHLVRSAGRRPGPGADSRSLAGRPWRDPVRVKQVWPAQAPDHELH